MKESVFQAKLLKALRQHPALVNAVIFKHSDRLHGGIPDVSITVNGNTSWFELKVEPNTPSKLQQHYLNKLGRRAHVVTLRPLIDIVYIDGMSFEFKTATHAIAEFCLGLK